MSVIKNLYHKAQRSLAASYRLHGEGDFDFAVSRAYYALFYVAEALLIKRKKQFSKHSAVISAFYHTYIETEEIDSFCHTVLNYAYRLRQKGDYWTEDPVTEEVSEELLKQCETFFEATKQFFKE